MNDNDILAGIVAAIEEASIPRVVATFEHTAGTVDIIEPVTGSDDGVWRGYLWAAVIGDYVLTPTRRGDYDDTRWVPGQMVLLPGAEVLAHSSTSAGHCVRNAMRALRKRA